MKLSEYKKLEKNIENEDFHKSYANINKVMFFLSIFGHLCSIFLAFFFVFKIISGIIPNGLILSGIISVVLLSGIELLKREIFDKMSVQQLKHKSLFHKNVVVLFVFAILIVSMSFFSSLKGAAEFSSKSKEIDTKKEVIITSYEDSINKVYSDKIVLLENKKEDKNKKLDKVSDNTLVHKISVDEKERINNRISDIKQEIASIDSDINSLKRENIYLIEKKTNKISSKIDKEKNENNSNSFIFMIISTIVELIILIGVYFNEIYKYRSYSEFKDKIETDPNYINYINCDDLLNIIFIGNIKINDRLPSTSALLDLCKINHKTFTEKELLNYIKLFTSLNITNTSGSFRYCLKTKDAAKEIIKKHFNIE
jgi:uncharacterized membrane protein affecting hemolysin expression